MTAARETVYPVTSWSEYNEPGLTKREMFAMMSLQGLIANPDFLTEAADESLDPFAAAAQLAVRQADALIAELNKETP